MTVAPSHSAEGVSHAMWLPQLSDELQSRGLAEEQAPLWQDGAALNQVERRVRGAMCQTWCQIEFTA